MLLHLPKNDVRRVVNELGRVLAKNGRLVLQGSFPNALNCEGVMDIRNNFRRTTNGPVRVYTRREVRGMFNEFATVEIEAHNVTVLPRRIGRLRLPFAGLSRKVNRYCSERFANRFRHSSWLVSHHDVVAIK